MKLKKTLLSILLLCSLCFCFTSVSAAEQGDLSLALSDSAWMKVDGQFRSRFLFNSGKDLNSDNENSEFISQRFRLGTELGFKDNFRIYAQLQDVRVWGEETSTLGDYTANGFDFHQAFGEVTLCEKHKFRLGRQEIALDSQRLVGSVGWADQGRSFDGARFMADHGDFEFNLFFTKVVEKHSINASQMDYDFGGVWFKYNKLNLFKPSFLFLADTDYTKDQKRFTTGLHATGKSNEFNYIFEFYYQFGDMGKNDIAAFMGSLKAGYNSKGDYKPSFHLFADYLSGDDDANDDTIKSFDTLFATNHKFYGYVDFFTNIPVHTKNMGLIDTGAVATITPCDKGKFSLAFHKFILAQEDGSGEKDLGWEIDAVAKRGIRKNLTLSLGYSLFSPGEAMINMKATKDNMGNEIKNEDMEHFAFMMLVMNFK